MHSQTLIAVSDVQSASRWYQTVLGCESRHGGAEYEQLAVPGEASFFLQLHAWGAHDHPNLGEPNAAPHGYGVLLWFEVDDFAAAVERAASIDAKVVTPPHVNPRANQRECWLMDWDGYVVVLASKSGDTGE